MERQLSPGRSSAQCMANHLDSKNNKNKIAMNRLINEDGVLNIEDLLQNNASFLAMIEDKIVTKEEKREQSAKIVALLKQIDEQCNDEQVELVRNLMAEFCAYIFVCSNYPESK